MEEEREIRRIIEEKLGIERVKERRWMICGDLNDYRESIMIGGDEWNGYEFKKVMEEESEINVMMGEGFEVNMVERSKVMDRWKIYNKRGKMERKI